MKILKILLSWSAFYCLPSFADLSKWVTFIEKSDPGYSVKYNDTLNKSEKNKKTASLANDGGVYFQNILGLNWDFRSPHYSSHFANRDGALLNPIRNNTPPDFPLTTGTKRLHTAFEVLDGNIDKFIKDDILGNISFVEEPTKKDPHQDYIYKVTLSASKPWYKCIKRKSVLKWSAGKEHHRSGQLITELNNNGFVMPNNAHVDHNVRCTEMEKTRDVTITANDAGEVTSIYPT